MIGSSCQFYVTKFNESYSICSILKLDTLNKSDYLLVPVLLIIQYESPAPATHLFLEHNTRKHACKRTR